MPAPLHVELLDLNPVQASRRLGLIAGLAARDIDRIFGAGHSHHSHLRLFFLGLFHIFALLVHAFGHCVLL